MTRLLPLLLLPRLVDLFPVVARHRLVSEDASSRETQSVRGSLLERGSKQPPKDASSRETHSVRGSLLERRSKQPTKEAHVEASTDAAPVCKSWCESHMAAWDAKCGWPSLVCSTCEACDVKEQLAERSWRNGPLRTQLPHEGPPARNEPLKKPWQETRWPKQTPLEGPTAENHLLGKDDLEGEGKGEGKAKGKETWREAPKQQLAQQKSLSDYSMEELSAEMARRKATVMAKDEDEVLRPPHDRGRVCVSIAAYEEPTWINALLENALKFTEPGTHIMLHLNSMANYTEAQLDAWNRMKRVSVTPERVGVRAFHGGILYSHMLNVQHMPSFCQHFIMQASNMMWVRHGMENAVRGQMFGGIFNVSCAGGMCQKRVKNEFYRERLVAIRGRYGWGQHEGAFYPIWVAQSFLSHLNRYLLESNLEVQEAVVDSPDDAEEWWLQTYMVNKMPWKEEYQPALSLFDTSGESCSAEAVRAIAAGKKPPPPPMNEKLWNKKWGFYAVKRVARDLNHPVTQLIMSLE